jgi:predicted outer membrane protein
VQNPAACATGATAITPTSEIESPNARAIAFSAGDASLFAGAANLALRRGESEARAEFVARIDPARYK